MDDEPLVRQIVSGNRDAFRLLVLRYQRPLFRFLALLGFSPAAAEDLAQQTFLRVFQSLGTFDPSQAKFSTWLFTIAKRLAANEADRSHHRHEDSAVDAATAAEQVPAAPLVEPAVAAERSRRLDDAIAALPAPLRSTFFLSQVRELTLLEVAAVEGCAVGTVKSRIHRAREQLRAALTDEET